MTAGDDPGNVPPPRRRAAGRRPPAGAVLVAAGVAAAATARSPWPGALAVRALFRQDAARSRAALQAHVPACVTTATIAYRPGDRRALLDLHLPAGTAGPLPVVVWVHGGGWVSGSRSDAGPYFAALASRGFAVASVDYTLAPAARYPEPVRQVNDAVTHLVAGADRYGIDPDRLVLAGDSAGAQIASQVALLATDERYAAAVGIAPAADGDRVRAVVLHCGIYDLAAFVDQGRRAANPLVRWGVASVVRAYVGDGAGRAASLALMSTLDRVTSAFPPAFVGAGNGDPLTATQSRPLADRLAGLGVDVAARIYPPDHEPRLPHEFQFDLDRPEGRAVLDETVAFLEHHAGREH